ncbi:MAG TPA: hypothetical protein PKC67_13560 [Kiritimatiellia bacterium]|nr:hypothetical protein [Kiritimatiellia bacterium]HMP35361.1 hypothetical protein [Kiritimatiellia bacterium]
MSMFRGVGRHAVCGLCAGLVALSGWLPAAGQEPAPVAQPVVAERAEGPGFWSAALWYLPNRVMDLVDIVRLRLKVGPGFGVTARATDFAAFYVGSQKTAFIGLPGPRYPDTFRYPFGLEYQRGLVIAGVDASDERPHPPRYGFAEVDVGLHLGLVGAEVGLDPFEVADFLAGWLFMDLRGDDYPRRRVELPEQGRVMSHFIATSEHDTINRPSVFASTQDRLDYLAEQVPNRLQNQMQSFDARFAGEGDPVIVHPPMDELTMGLYTRTLVGDKTEIELKPDVNLDVDLPNLERRVSLFVESSSSDDLPGRDKLEREDDGWTVGARSKKNIWDISTDVGVRAKWLPEVFARAAWKPTWAWGTWKWNFEQRVFWESDDGFGELTTLGALKWFAGNRWVYRQNTSGKFTEASDGYEWEQTFMIGRPITLFDESRRETGRAIGAGDAIEGYGARASVFGSDDATDQYRLLATYRWDLYQRFVIGEVRAGPQWRDSEEWDTEYRVDLGVELHF